MMATQPAMITAEVRWFYPGNLPNSLLHWFEQDCLGNNLEPPEKREDVYLIIPECDYLNLKLRQQRLEVKWRQAKLEEITFNNHSAGCVEKWLKWICGTPPNVSLAPITLSSESQWIRVKKSRFQRKYQVTNTILKSVSKNKEINQGCTVELTQLTLQNNLWWSLAFESFGKDSRLLETLKITMDELSVTYPTFPLQKSHSYAYPKWLMDFGVSA